MRKKRLLLVAGACLATVSLGVGTASLGVGTALGQDVMNGTGGTIASGDAAVSATITTKDPATFPQCSNIPRPSDSGDGLNALAGLKAGFPAECLDFARS